MSPLDQLNTYIPGAGSQVRGPIKAHQVLINKGNFFIPNSLIQRQIISPKCKDLKKKINFQLRYLETMKIGSESIKMENILIRKQPPPNAEFFQKK